METNMNKLHKEAKQYLDSLRAMTSSQQRLAENISQFYSEKDQNCYAAAKYKETLDHLDESCRIPADNSFRTTVFDPITRFVLFFNDVNDLIKKRSHKLLDYDSARTKVRKLVEKPSDDPSKLPKAEAEMNERKGIYESIHNQLMADLPKLIAMRTTYLEPCFESYLKSQKKFFEEGTDLLESLRTQLKAQATGDPLSEMGKLTITGPI